MNRDFKVGDRVKLRKNIMNPSGSIYIKKLSEIGFQFTVRFISEDDRIFPDHQHPKLPVAYFYPFEIEHIEHIDENIICKNKK